MLVAALRLAVFVFAVHFGGLVHAVVDFVHACEAVALHESDDCGDGDDHCPANCPNCHCSHGASASLPPRAPTGDAVLPDANVQVLVIVPHEAPPGRDLPSIFRPPRSAFS